LLWFTNSIVQVWDEVFGAFSDHQLLNGGTLCTTWCNIKKLYIVTV